MDNYENYLDKGKEVLRILINNGCEAYIIGEAVFKRIMQIPFCVVDITTNATPDVIKGIFSFTKFEEEGTSIRLYYSGYEFLIRTFRTAQFKDKRDPKRIHYSKVFHEELANCDFTINAIAMTHGGKLVDAYRGFRDIKRKVVRVIGNPKVRFQEDPIRILRAVRYVSELGFKIERRTLRGMRSRGRLLAKVDPTLLSEELNKLLYGKYLRRALKYIRITRLYRRIPQLSKDLKRWTDSYRMLDPLTFLALVFVREGRYLLEWEGALQEQDQEQLKLLVELALTVPKGKYSPENLFNYGLDICLNANYINYLLRKDRRRFRRIKRNYKKLVIKDVKELNFSAVDILKLTDNRDGDYVEIVVEAMIKEVLNENVNNDYESLHQFTVNKLEEIGILKTKEPKSEEAIDNFDMDIVELEEQTTPFIESTSTPTPPPTMEMNGDDLFIPESKLAELERRIAIQEDLLEEREEKIRELEKMALENKLESDIKDIVGQNIELLKDMNYIEKGSEKMIVSRELKDLYRRIITTVEPKYKVLNQVKRNEENNEN